MRHNESREDDRKLSALENTSSVKGANTITGDGSKKKKTDVADD